ncbi:uncharacterized protein LOC124497631 [Dermatophagoides farinae]|uniref:Heparin-binding protein-like protein n=1 Tax=Dermatophagoides farinae TaxID=6954 RepID=A0A922HTU3_DERFA|nr:protein odr-4 homolog [Dermatophagoides farinae]KAH7643003.1 heparin-binding protein-like protein [Dermatophagoides farinae]KAH9505895.1 hypothetical protein DERF_010662 [Dermatophagoides farinae]
MKTTLMIYVLCLVAQILLSLSIQIVSSHKDCKYEKGRWLDCDPDTGIQKRILRLKTYKAHLPDCIKEKHMERPCKKQCRYIKGAWSDCVNGMRERIDIIRTDISSSHCKAEKVVNKSCRKQCTYNKTEWSTCEKGLKNKTLTLATNPETPNSHDCEPVKNVVKPCSNNSGNNNNNINKNNKNNVNKVKKNSNKKNGNKITPE